MTNKKQTIMVKSIFVDIALNAQKYQNGKENYPAINHAKPFLLPKEGSFLFSKF